MSLTALGFTLEEVKAQVGEEGSCLKEEEKEITVLIHPKYGKAHYTGVKNELDVLSRRYSKILGGMVVGYDNVRLVSPHGWVFDTNPFIHLKITAKFYVFCPKPLDKLKVVVKKKSPYHLGCLAHGAYNISVPRPPESTNSEEEEEWAGAFAMEGDTLILSVLFASYTNKHLPYIRATIHPDCVKELKEKATAVKEEDNTEKVQNTRKIFDDDDDSGISSNEAEEIKKRKEGEEKEKEKEGERKKKKEKENTSSDDISRKGKKRKRSQEENEEEVEDKRKKRRKRESLITEEKEKTSKNKKKQEELIIHIKKEKNTSEEEEEKEENKGRKAKGNQIVIKTEGQEEEKEEERRTKKKKKIKEEKIEEMDLPIPLYMIKKEKKKTKKEKG